MPVFRSVTVARQPGPRWIKAWSFSETSSSGRVPSASRGVHLAIVHALICLR